MMKRSRDEESAHRAPQQAKHGSPTQPSPPRHCREPSVGGETKKAREPVEKRILGAEANGVAGDPLPTQGEAMHMMESRVLCDARLAAVELPRWRRLWLGRGGGMVVDWEELLWGWFPFVDEDFSSDEEVGWHSSWGHQVAGQQQQHVFYDDIWQLEHINEIPSHSR